MAPSVRTFEPPAVEVLTVKHGGPTLGPDVTLSESDPQSQPYYSTNKLFKTDSLAKIDVLLSLNNLISSAPHLVESILAYLDTPSLVALQAAYPSLLSDAHQDIVLVTTIQLSTGPLPADSYLESLSHLLCSVRSTRRLLLQINITHYSGNEMSRLARFLNQSLGEWSVDHLEICHVSYGSRRRDFDWAHLSGALKNFRQVASIKRLTLSATGHLVPPSWIIAQEIALFPNLCQVNQNLY